MASMSSTRVNFSLDRALGHPRLHGCIVVSVTELKVSRPEAPNDSFSRDGWRSAHRSAAPGQSKSTLHHPAVRSTVRSKM